MMIKQQQLNIKKKDISKMKNSTNFLKSDNFAFAQYAQYKKSLKFGEIKLKLKEFHRSKQSMYLNQVQTNKIVISDEFKLDNCVKNFIRYRNGEIVKPLYIVLAQIYKIF